MDLLTGGHAHVTLKQALRGLAPALRGRRPDPSGHSIYEELEHMRLAQQDILRYTVDPGWRSPAWPEGYWPKKATPTEAQWKRCVNAFETDLAELVALVRRKDLDLTSPIPHGQDGHTYLREILLTADHNAYHLGQLVQTRKLLGAWPTR
ncbi:MAG: DinB family protein [Vicinamibacteria bacterium]